jgi:hypothetical protein
MTHSPARSWIVPVVIALTVVAAVYAVIALDVSGPGTLPTSDLTEFEPTAPELIIYRELPAIKTQLAEVRGVAVGPNDEIYVLGDRELNVYEKAGRLLRTLPASPTARAVAIDREGNTYLAEADRFVMLDSQGQAKLTSEASGPNADFTSIAVTSDAVLVGDAGNRVILQYTREGKIARRIRKVDPTRRIDGVLMPSAHFDVAVGADRLIRANDPGRQKVDVYTADGELLASWGEPSLKTQGFCGCCNPTDIALLPDGSVVTAEKGLPRVKVYSPDGTFLGVVAGHEAFPDGRCPLPDCSQGMTLDLAVDSAGRILVLDPASRSVRIYVKKEPQ